MPFSLNPIGAGSNSVTSKGKEDAKAVTSEKSNNNNKSVKSAKDAGINIGKNLISLKNDGKQFVEEVNRMLSQDRTVVEYAFWQFNNNSDKSILPLLEQYKNEDGYDDVMKRLNGMRVRSGFIENEFIAYDLVKALNSNDPEQIKAAADKLNPRTIKHVYSAYAQMTKTSGEKRFQGNVLTGTRRQMTGGINPESLLQGFLNNKSLTNEQKREYLNKIIDNVLNSQIKNRQAANALREKREDLVEYAIKYTNSFHIESYISKIYNFG